MDDELIQAIFREPSGRHDGVDATRRALRELGSTRAALDRLEAALVRRARFAGTTWSEIAADLGVSRPTARRRHTDPADRVAVPYTSPRSTDDSVSSAPR